VAVDNLDRIPPWLSDALCRAVTGDGWLRRALYTDGAIAVVTLRIAVILTAIDAGALRGDLADRVAVVELQPIGEAERLEDADLAARFHEAHPRLLGAFLDLLARVEELLPTIKLDRRPRMADYARVLRAVDKILGTSGLAVYLEQRGELQREAAEGDPVGMALLSFMLKREEWSGTAGDLLVEISPDHPGREWPKTPRGLSARLRHLEHPLLAAGLRVTFPGPSGHEGRRLLALETVRNEPTASSASSAATSGPGGAGADGADGADGQSQASSTIPLEFDYPPSAWGDDPGPPS
jgi:hypothetical protein